MQSSLLAACAKSNLTKFYYIATSPRGKPTPSEKRRLGSSHSKFREQCLRVIFVLLVVLIVCLLAACRHQTVEEPVFTNEGPYVVLLVDAQHLDYTNVETLFYSIHSNPRATVGHAWFYLSGNHGVIEGGHSGELGITEPRYLESIFLYKEEPNPVRHLFKSLNDGYFETGPGIHKPTYAIRVELSQMQYEMILRTIDPNCYPYARYSLTDNQCATLVAKVAALAGVPLEHEITIPIQQRVLLNDEELQLWDDPIYSSMTVSSPDVLEKSMQQAVLQKRAEPALAFYRKMRKKMNASPRPAVARAQ